MSTFLSFTSASLPSTFCRTPSILHSACVTQVSLWPAFLCTTPNAALRLAPTHFPPSALCVVSSPKMCKYAPSAQGLCMYFGSVVLVVESKRENVNRICTYTPWWLVVSRVRANWRSLSGEVAADWLDHSSAQSTKSTRELRNCVRRVVSFRFVCVCVWVCARVCARRPPTFRAGANS